LKSEYSGNVRFKFTRSKRNLIKLLGYTIILILLIELGRIILGIWAAKPVVAEWGVIEKGCWVEALFLREEIVINSEFEGSITQKVKNGSRVPRGTVIASLNTGSGLATEPSQASLALEKRLLLLNTEDQDLAIELERVNNEINLKKGDLRKLTPATSEIKEDLGSLEQEKRQILRNIKSVRDKILRTQVAVKNELNGLKGVIAPESGYLFFQYDSWEGKLCPDRFYELSDEEFRNNYPLKSTSNRVKPGSFLAKVISPFNQMIAVTIDTSLTGTPKVGDCWEVKTNDCSHRVVIKDSIPLAGRKMILAFDDPGISERYLPNRRSKIFIIYRKVKGITIPTQALYKNGRQTMVKIRKGDGYSPQEVQVLESDGEQAIIEGIDFGTTILSR
jgi:hypothetical protein